MVHAFWARFLVKLPEGARPWSLVAAGQARSRLHRILRVPRVPDAAKYGTHDFRRGHADDMRRSGSTLAEILAAGQWKSSAFMNYINEAELQQEVAIAVAIEADVEDWIDQSFYMFSLASARIHGAGHLIHPAENNVCETLRFRRHVVRLLHFAAHLAHSLQLRVVVYGACSSLVIRLDCLMSMGLSPGFHLC